MNILYDISSSQVYGNMKTNGGGEYTYSVLLRVLESNSNHNIYILKLSNHPLTCKVSELCQKNKLTIKEYSSNEDIVKIVDRCKIDRVVFPVCYVRYNSLYFGKKVEIISVIHDLCDVYYWGKCRVKYGRFMKKDGLNWLRWLKYEFQKKRNEKMAIEQHNRLLNIGENQKIITVSHFSKNSILYYLKARDKEIEVLYTVQKKTNNSIENETEILSNYGLESKRFFVLLAGCRWTKNNAIVIKAFEKMLRSNRDILENYKFLVLGNDNTSASYYRSIIYNKDKYILEGYVEDDVLEVLVKNAHMLVFPSVLEGFGMPPIEAMEKGVLVAASNSMSIPEICGDGALYFDPHDIDSIIIAIMSGFDDELKYKLVHNMDNVIKKLRRRQEEDLKKLVKIILGDKED